MRGGQMKELKEGKGCPIAGIVNSLFLTSPYEGKDWESVRKDLITMFKVYTRDDTRAEPKGELGGNELSNNKASLFNSSNSKAPTNEIERIIEESQKTYNKQFPTVDANTKSLKYILAQALSHLKPLKELDEGEVLKFLENYWKSDRYSNFDGVDDEDLAKAITKTFGTQEKINIKCDKCNEYLTEPGSLLFEPTDDPVLFKKTHICVGCKE